MSATLESLRRAAKLAAHHLGALAVLRRLRQRERSIVLRYHAVSADTTPEPLYAGPDITIPRSLFEAQMRFLCRAYRPVPLDAILGPVRAGRAPAPGTVAVTLDDGYADNFEHAFPVLRDLRVPATVYVVSETIDAGPVLWMSELRAAVMATTKDALRVEIGGGHEFGLADVGQRQRAIKDLTNVLVPIEAALRRRMLCTLRDELGVNGDASLQHTMLTSAQIRALHEGGITIGAHTQTHSNMTLLAPEQVRAEIGGSRERIEAIVGVPVPDFAYPNTGGRFPHFNGAVAQIVRDLGFRSAVTSRPGIVDATTNPYIVPRIGVAPRVYREEALAVTLERYRWFGRANA